MDRKEIEKVIRAEIISHRATTRSMWRVIEKR
jgi:hypothetical protein